MKRILIITLLLIGINNTYSQTDFFGGLAPQKTKKVVNLPNKPNKVDELGRKQGEWAKKYPNGRYIYEATFVDNIPIDTVKRYYEDGTISLYQIYKPATDSCYVINFNDENKKGSEGFYIKGKKVGTWLFYNNNGNIVTKSNYNNDIIDGLSITYYPTGEILEKINYKNGVLHGPWQRFYSSGATQTSASYNNGVLDGHYKVINDNGDVSIEGVYKNGKQIGDWKTFDNNTRKHFIVKYDNNGNIVNEEEIHERNQKRLDYYEKNRHNLVDPAHQNTDPSSYNF